MNILEFFNPKISPLVQEVLNSGINYEKKEQNLEQNLNPTIYVFNGSVSLDAASIEVNLIPILSINGKTVKNLNFNEMMKLRKMAGVIINKETKIFDKTQPISSYI